MSVFEASRASLDGDVLAVGDNGVAIIMRSGAPSFSSMLAPSERRLSAHAHQHEHHACDKVPVRTGVQFNGIGEKKAVSRSP